MTLSGNGSQSFFGVLRGSGVLIGSGVLAGSGVLLGSTVLISCSKIAHQHLQNPSKTLCQSKFSKDSVT